MIEAARTESCRNRMMLALSYDSALRREELCGLETSDIDPAHRMVTIRAEITKNRRAQRCSSLRPQPAICSQPIAAAAGAS